MGVERKKGKEGNFITTFNWTFQVEKQMTEHSWNSEEHQQNRGPLVLLLLMEHDVWTADEQPQSSSAKDERPQQRGDQRKGRHGRDVLKTGSTGLNGVRED